jgi:hypothetical protein
VRFASVYRQFKTVQELMDEARAVIDAQHYDVPGQGKLFIEPPNRGEHKNGNGNGAAPPAEGDKPRVQRGRKPKPPAAVQENEKSG